jgi:hypothetical protein
MNSNVQFRFGFALNNMNSAIPDI